MLKNMKTAIVLLTLFIISCRESRPKNDKQTLDFGAFTIEVPNTWKKIKRKGIDSYTGGIAIDSVDTIGFDLGVWSNSLTEQPPVIWERSSFQFPKNFDTTQVVLVDDLRGIDPDKYRKQTLTWDTIDGREVKVVYPRKPGKGVTGIYIDSLRQTRSEIDRFNLYGIDLKSQNQQEFLKTVKTIKFKEQK